MKRDKKNNISLNMDNSILFFILFYKLFYVINSEQIYLKSSVQAVVLFTVYILLFH